MALRSPSSTPRWDLGPRDSPPAESSSPTSQGGFSNGARADVASKTEEVEHMLAKLEEEGVEIDGKIASMIDDEIARIKVEAARDNMINGLKRKGMVVLLTISSAVFGFVLGVEITELTVYENVAKAILFGW